MRQYGVRLFQHDHWSYVNPSAIVSIGEVKLQDNIDQFFMTKQNANNLYKLMIQRYAGPVVIVKFNTRYKPYSEMAVVKRYGI